MIDNRPTLGFFFELNGSLELWDSVGFLQREITLYNRLAREHFGRIYFFTYGDGTDLKFRDLLEPNIIIVPLRKKPRSFLEAFFYELTLPFLRYSILKECDFIKTNQNSGAIAASITKLIFPRKKLIIRSGYIGSELGKKEATPLVRMYYFLVENFSYRICDHILIPLHDSLILRKKYRFLKNKVTAHNNFIDTEKFMPSGREKTYDIIYVARFSQGKNHKALLESVIGSGTKILLIGNGPERRNVEALAKKLSLDCTFIESVPNDELPAYYNSSKICVFPSLYEGNPKALLEAMACGLPVLALPVSGIENIIDSGSNGLLTDENGLKTEISRLLRDHGFRDTLGIEARKTILEKYSLEKILRNELGVYRKLSKL